MDTTIQWEGDSWRVLSIGAEDTFGRLYTHLASATRTQRGRLDSPVQMADFLPSHVVHGALGEAARVVCTGNNERQTLYVGRAVAHAHGGITYPLLLPGSGKVFAHVADHRIMRAYDGESGAYVTEAAYTAWEATQPGGVGFDLRVGERVYFTGGKEPGDGSPPPGWFTITAIPERSETYGPLYQLTQDGTGGTTCLSNIRRRMVGPLNANVFCTEQAALAYNADAERKGQALIPFPNEAATDDVKVDASFALEVLGKLMAAKGVGGSLHAAANRVREWIAVGAREVPVVVSDLTGGAWHGIDASLPVTVVLVDTDAEEKSDDELTELPDGEMAYCGIYGVDPDDIAPTYVHDVLEAARGNPAQSESPAPGMR